MGKKLCHPVHSKYTAGIIQVDTISLSIPFSHISKKGLKLLEDWYMDEFETATIDWEKEEIVLSYDIESCTQKGYTCSSNRKN